MIAARALAVALVALALPLAAADGLLRKKAPEFLPVDEAFELQPLVWRDGALEVSWRIAGNYYLYRDKLKFTAVAPKTLRLASPRLPASMRHEDEHFGVVQIYRGDLTVRVPVAQDAAGDVRITVAYQGCADAGLCYPPQTRTLETPR